jgi:ferredoxin
MQAKVDKDSCIGCELCVTICPEVFKLGDDGLVETIDQEIAEAYLDKAKEAKDCCPLECISIE